MFALVNGAPKPLRIASDQASSLRPLGVWYSAVAMGVSSGLGEGRGLGEGCGLGATALGVVGVAVLAAGRAFGRCEADGDAEARDREGAGSDEAAGAELGVSRMTLADGAIRGSGALVVLAVSGVGTAPRPTEIARPSRATASPSPVSRRHETGGRFSTGVRYRPGGSGRPPRRSP